MENCTECGPVCSNKHPCPCTSTDCENHGRCCDCVAYHLGTGSLTVCMRPVAKG